MTWEGEWSTDSRLVLPNISMWKNVLVEIRHVTIPPPILNGRAAQITASVFPSIDIRSCILFLFPPQTHHLPCPFTHGNLHNLRFSCPSSHSLPSIPLRKLANMTNVQQPQCHFRVLRAVLPERCNPGFGLFTLAVVCPLLQRLA